MLNARNGFVATILAVLVLSVSPAFADDQGSKDAAMDMNARMQQKLNSKLGGNIGGGELDIDSKLSDRINKKTEETNRQLDDQSNAVTAADRSGKSEADGEEAEANQ